MESTSRLAKALADHLDEDLDSESFRSKVQYNVGKLEAKGFINREKAEKSFKTELSTMGELWLATHNENGDNKVPA
jgi:DNA-binding MarR family transcriptional regulator